MRIVIDLDTPAQVFVREPRRAGRAARHVRAAPGEYVLTREGARALDPDAARDANALRNDAWTPLDRLVEHLSDRNDARGLAHVEAVVKALGYVDDDVWRRVRP